MLVKNDEELQRAATDDIDALEYVAVKLNNPSSSDRLVEVLIQRAFCTEIHV